MSNDEFDIICVGSGAAGLAGALRAVDRGVSTLVLEKAAAFGGTTAWSYGGIWAGDNHVMRALGITDTLEEAAIRKIRDQSREATRAAGADETLGLAEELDHAALAVE